MTAVLPVDLVSSELAIETRGLVKQYGAHRALNDLQLQVPSGSVYLLVGPNGAGKSTTIKILLDLLRPTLGEARVLGMDVRQNAALVRANMGYVPEALSWGHGWMTVGRLLNHHAAYFPSWDAQYAQQLISTFGLPVKQKVKTLSKGQGRRLHLLMALAHRPPVLLLDEPTDGLDPVMRDETLRVLIAHVADTPTTMLISTHHVGEVEQLADHIGVVRDGALCAQTPLETLRRKLRRYRADLPPGWSGAPTINGAAIRRTTTRNEIDWIVWGDEADIAQRLTNSGASVRSSAPLGLEEATLALLSPAESIR